MDHAEVLFFLSDSTLFSNSFKEEPLGHATSASLAAGLSIYETSLSFFFSLLFEPPRVLSERDLRLFLLIA
jgi:hypothetical protein